MKKIKCRIKYGIVAMMIIMSMAVLTGCNKSDEEAENVNEETLLDAAENGANDAIQSAMESAQAIADEQQAIADAEQGEDETPAIVSTPIPGSTGLTSDQVLGNPTPVSANPQDNIPDYINVDRNNNGAISGGNNNDDAFYDTPIPPYGQNNKKTTPQVFDIGDCMVEVGGDYSSQNCDTIIAKVNELRAAYNIPLCTKNTGLCKVADRRVKELKYYWGPIRPDGTPWNSIAPEYYLAESMACTTALGGVNKACDGIISGTISRKNIMNEEFLSIGASYFQSGDLVYVVVSMGY